MIRKTLLGALALAVWLPVAALAVEPDEILTDPALEARAREVGKQLRCVVCQNQSIDDSNAELARDMRVLVRERILKGDSDREILDYMVSRYGDFVLLDPPFKGTTYVLWFGPAAIAVLGVAALAGFYRRRKATAGEDLPPDEPPPLTEAEKKRLAKLLDGEEGR